MEKDKDRLRRNVPTGAERLAEVSLSLCSACAISWVADFHTPFPSLLPHFSRLYSIGQTTLLIIEYIYG